MASGLPVVFHGGFDRGRVAAVYGTLDVLVVPSLWPENSPLVVHEAFMHGVAVVGSRMGGIPDLVEHDVNGLLYDSFAPAALGAALQSLIDVPARAAKLARAAPAVKSIDADAREWEERYTKVTRESKGTKEVTKEG
jgi:glycosyltransferase involved in cell wall biosynthesis